MQISRHWRLNAVRYRLQGVRYENGETSLQNRPEPLSGAIIREASKEVKNCHPEHSGTPEGRRIVFV